MVLSPRKFYEIAFLAALIIWTTAKTVRKATPMALP
jgi:hypothetical protein